MSSKRKRPSIRDVAAKAGVSISTVSHVFSGARPISKATEKRVLEAAKELSYRPNASAQSLRTASTGIIGFALRPRDAVPGSLRGTQTFERLIGATAANVLQSGRGLLLVPDLLAGGSRQVPMDGCIVAHPYGNDAVLTDLLNRQVPVVTVDVDPDRPELPWSIAIDYRSAMIEILDRLFATGARRILLLSGTEDNAWNRLTAQTSAEWAEANRVELKHEHLYEGQAESGAYDQLTSALDSQHRPDAIITAASTFAAGALRMITDRGLSVPDDVQLVALTDSEYTRSASPAVSGLDLELEACARDAVSLLLRQLDGGDPPEKPVVVAPTVYWRASTK